MKALKYSISLTCILLLLCSKAEAQSSVIFNTSDNISNLILPNVFTPNEDSINDVFKPALDEITELSFSIFSRYGNLIFETNRLNGFWDGRTTSGVPCSDGVYFCVLTATGIDGKTYKEKIAIQLFTNGFYKN